jgi:hypothetical protein
MAVTIHGLSSVIVEPGAVLSEAADSGAFSFQETRRGKTADIETLFNSLVRRSTAHPKYTFLGLESKSITFDEGGQAAISLLWTGSSAATSGTPPLPAPIWTLSRSPSQEPIDTHPDFEAFAGTPASPLNGAIFDEDGLFVRFAADDPNVWGGVSKYLEMAAVLTKVSVVRTEPSSDEVIPRRETPSTGSAIDVPTITGRNWLKTDYSKKQSGSVWELTEEWTMSGQQGWNEELYPA